MVNTKNTRKAMIIAYNAHKNQFDKAGVPYVYHPIYLAEQMDTEEECIIALLHDVVEDTAVTFEDLEKEFSQTIINTLKLLTRSKKEDYFKYISRIAENELAKKIKIEDIKHNASLDRLDKITLIDKLRNKKYKKALKILLEGTDK